MDAAAGGVSFDHGVPAVDVGVDDNQQIGRVRIGVAGWLRVGWRDSLFVSSYGQCNVEAYEPGYI